jgi:hypothetical protein
MIDLNKMSIYFQDIIDIIPNEFFINYYTIPLYYDVRGQIF